MDSVRTIVLAAVCAVATVRSARAGEPAELTRMRDQYDRQARHAMLPILQSYARDLENLSVRLSMQRDAGGARQAQDELDKLKAKIASLNEAPVLTPPQLAQKKSAELNLVENPGFETGGADGWFLFNTDADRTKADRGERQAHEGRYCLRLKRAEGPHDMAGALQDLAGRVRPGDRVRGTAWIRCVKAAGPDKVIFAVALKARTGDRILQLVSKTAKGTGEWEQLAIEFVVPTKAQEPDLGAIHLFVGIGGKTDIGDVLVDDVFAGPATEP